MEEESINVKQADDDADLLIVKTALELYDKPPVIVAEDVDILVLITALTPSNKKIYLLKPTRGTMSASLFSSDNSFRKYKFCKENILFLHALTGCDTTSCFYGKGKKSVFNSIEKKSINSDLKEAIEEFKLENQPQTSIYKNGLLILLYMYNAPKKITYVDKYKHTSFTKAISKKKKSLKPVKLESLPPTSDAAKQHFYRVYLQVQQWLGNDLIPKTGVGMLEKV